MLIEFDSFKRDETLKWRGLDFADACEVFSAPHIQQLDQRKDYGENRYIVFGMLKQEYVVMVYTNRGENRRIISMRKANEREISKHAQHLG